MARCLLLLAVIGVLAPVLGCRTCADPYRDCGPLYGGQCGEACNARGRVGSIIAPAPMPAAVGIQTGGPPVDVPGTIIYETDTALPPQGSAVSYDFADRPVAERSVQWAALSPDKTPTR